MFEILKRVPCSPNIWMESRDSRDFKQSLQTVNILENCFLKFKNINEALVWIINTVHSSFKQFDVMKLDAAIQGSFVAPFNI